MVISQSETCAIQKKEEKKTTPVIVFLFHLTFDTAVVLVVMSYVKY